MCNRVHTVLYTEAGSFVKTVWAFEYFYQQVGLNPDTGG